MNTLHMVILLASIAALPFSYDAKAGIILTDSVENDNSWTVTGNGLHFLGSVAGISPTAGSTVMHLQNIGGREGIKMFTGNTVAAGIYTLSFDIGNFNNAPFANFNLALTGLTANGTVLAPTTSNTPTPPDGGILAWMFTYNIGVADSSIGNTLGFRISLPNSGQNQNASFDNLTVSYDAPVPVPEPAILLLFGSALAGLGIIRKRAKLGVVEKFKIWLQRPISVFC